MTTVSKILVANRGEIACRVLTCARELGYGTVAVYSDADAGARHTQLADQAVNIGPAPASESYLKIENILAAAAASGADAIHPGYGFLSENAEFAQACKTAGVTFIGPPPEVIEAMGNKAHAKRLMREAGVPCVPGYEGDDQSASAMLAAGESIGFPLMVKAAAGGGGRGMRLVMDSASLANALELAASEAKSAFGSAELILEKAFIGPRHVEIQIFADQHGNVVHLGERDCSIQRRHQKVVEESPCPVMTPALREAMGQAAIDAARSIGYVGAGTVEFLLDDAGEFYFLEMNTRLQVEHPVTEMVTGVDLVALQIAVAQGAELPLSQTDVALEGHAIEVRLYAEDPDQDFLPSTGRVFLWQPPAADGVRVDHGIQSGQAISPFYDSMVAKIVAWGSTRTDAIRKLTKALNQTALFGPQSNRDFLLAILKDPIFSRGEATTAFIDVASLSADGPSAEAISAAAAALSYRHQTVLAHAASVQVSTALLNWSSSGTLTSHFVYELDDTRRSVSVSPEAGIFRVTEGDQVSLVDISGATGSMGTIEVGGACWPAAYHFEGPRLYLALGGKTVCLSNLAGGETALEETAGGGSVTAPMHGMILELMVSEGDTVTQGQPLLVLEAMKMQHQVQAQIDGEIQHVHFAAGDQVAADEVMLEIKPLHE